MGVIFDAASRPARVDRGGSSSGVLLDALRRGGIRRGVTTGEHDALTRGVADALLLDGGPTAAALQPILSWRRDGGVGVGDGIAVADPSRPIRLPRGKRWVRLMFLSEPIGRSGPDGRPIDVLFLAAEAAGPPAGLAARLTEFLADLDARRLVRRESDERILQAVARFEGEQAFGVPLDSGRRGGVACPA